MTSQPRLRPTFLLIGSQKSGTTALYEYLSLHPNIAAPKQKEINFFVCSLLYARGLDFYHSCFPLDDPASSCRITFDASVNYLVSAEAAERIHAYDAKMKLIVLLRDPVLRAFSAWQMYRRFFQDNRDWYFQWMERCDAPIDRDSYIRRPASFGACFEEDVLAELEARSQGKSIEAPFLRHGFYEEQLRAYQEIFPAGQMLIEDSQRFRDDTRAVLGEIEEFLGIVRHTWAEDLIKPVYVDVRRHGQEAGVESRHAASVTVKAKRSKAAIYNGLPPQKSIDLLKEVYDERNQRLYALLGREFPWS